MSDFWMSDFLYAQWLFNFLAWDKRDNVQKKLLLDRFQAGLKLAAHSSQLVFGCFTVLK